MLWDIENGEEDQDEVVTVAESCEQRQFIHDCITGENLLRARVKHIRRREIDQKTLARSKNV